MAIPDLVDVGAPWKVLPPGIHEASLDQVAERFAIGDRRAILFDGLLRGCERLKNAGCRALYLDGSFVSDKPEPGDFDACWDPAGVDAGTLDPVFLDFDDGRKNQKARFGGEFFPSRAKADGSRTFVEYFSTEKTTGARKGLVLVRLDQ